MLHLLAVSLLLAAPVAPLTSEGQDQGRPPADVNAYPREAAFPAVLEQCTIGRPKELFDVLRVVDGDTLWVERGGEREKLRLLSIDTEEKFMENDLSASKPSTRYGDLVTGWAQGFFAPRSKDEGPIRVGLLFPGGKETRDPYGRLLCHVVTADGVDFNLLMVRMGMSPYFNKYGNSRISHGAFQAAQKAAMKEQRGIWNPETNKAGKKRPYGQLVPWWQARADAVDAFRALAKKSPLRFVSSDEPEALGAALEAGGKGVTVLALVDRFFDEDDGSRTVLLRSGDKKRAVRVSIAAKDRKAMAALDLEGSREDFRQNYLLVKGDLVQGRRGFDLVGVAPEDWRRAGPEPKAR